MSTELCGKFTIVNSPTWNGTSWRVVGDVSGTGVGASTDYIVGDIIFDNSSFGINRWKIYSVNSYPSSVRIDCQVVWDDYGSSSGKQPRGGTGAISKASVNKRFAEVPARSKAAIDEYLYTLISNINTRYITDNITGGGSAGPANLPFYEGTEAPLVTNMDVYNIRDAAGFEHEETQDVVFSLTQIPAEYISAGFSLFLSYAMSLTESSKTVRLKLEYTVHDNGEDIDVGTEYSDLQTIAVNETADILDIVEAFTIPAGRLTVDTQEVEFRLTRMGETVEDTHTGLFGLKDILAA